MSKLCLCVMLAISLATVDVACGEAPQPSTATTPADAGITWLPTLTEARDLARIRRAPIFVVFSATWCAPCRHLKTELLKTEVEAKLEQWIPVAIDVDEQPDVATEFGVSGIPQMLILSPDGRVVDSQAGAMSSEELVTWLESAYSEANSEFSQELVATGPPTLVSVVRILREFRRRDSSLREAAINRLSPYPQAAAPLVVQKLARGNLSERLAALELLEAWQAPLEGIDPWIPESLAPERFAPIDEWLKAKQFSVPLAENASPETLAEAARLLRSIVDADPAGAAAMREQFARLGPAVIPLLREAIADAPTDVARSRLTATRFRLAATPELIVKWPGGIERLASRDSEERVKAARELGELATPPEESLLLELFSDPAPLIREISLETLRKVSGKSANSALVRLLDDPDANVRAAVLKQLGEDPSASLIPIIAGYLTREQDPDLLVHAARLLRETDKPDAMDALESLFTHPSWRVRAEAVEGVNKLLESHRHRANDNAPSFEAAYIALLKDEDPFVVSRAIQGLAVVGRKDSVQPLLEAVQSHPELAADVLMVLSKSFILLREAADPLRAFTTHDSPQVRAAAIAGLIKFSADDVAEETRVALADPETSVRLATLDSLFDQTILEFALREQRVHIQHELDLRRQNEGPPSLTSVFSWIFRFGNQQPQLEFDIPVDSPEKTEDPQEQANEMEQREQAILNARSNPNIPAWRRLLQTELSALLEDSSPEVRLSAARLLAVSGNPAALPVLQNEIQTPETAIKAATALSSLPGTERRDLFRKIVSQLTRPEDLSIAAYQFASQPTPEVMQGIWELIAQRGTENRVAGAMVTPLLMAYFPDQYYDLSRATASQRNRCAADCQNYLANGTHEQKLIALVLLSGIDQESVVQAAKSLLDDPDQAAIFQLDAIKILLKNDDESEAQQRAIDLLSADDRKLAETGLAYLALGTKGIEKLTGEIPLSSDYGDFEAFSSSKPIAPLDPPDGVTVALLQPFLDAPVPGSAQAGALMALLDDPRGLAPLLDQWRKDRTNETWQRLTYRAISALDDDSHVPVLAEIYADLAKENYAWRINEFYWTIRTMTGAAALSLRQRIRAEQPPDVLRRD